MKDMNSTKLLWGKWEEYFGFRQTFGEGFKYLWICERLGLREHSKKKFEREYQFV